MEKVNFTSKYVGNARTASTARPSSPSKTAQEKAAAGWNDTVSRQEHTRDHHSKKDSSKKEPQKSPFHLFGQKYGIDLQNEADTLALVGEEKEDDGIDFSLPLPKKEKQSAISKEGSFSCGFAHAPVLMTQNHLEAEVMTDVKGTGAMDELYRGLVEHIQEMKQADKTEWTVELKNLPLFEGATLVLTEHASAKGEFTLAFYNLSSQAQQVVVNPLNQDHLKFSMEQKGLGVHILIASTQPLKVQEAFASRAFTGRDPHYKDSRHNPHQNKR